MSWSGSDFKRGVLGGRAPLVFWGVFQKYSKHTFPLLGLGYLLLPLIVYLVAYSSFGVDPVYLFPLYHDYLETREYADNSMLITQRDD